MWNDFANRAAKAWSEFPCAILSSSSTACRENPLAINPDTMLSENCRIPPLDPEAPWVLDEVPASSRLAEK